MSTRRVVQDAEARPVLVPAGNKERAPGRAASAKPAAKAVARNEATGNDRLSVVRRIPASDRLVPLSSSVSEPVDASRGSERFVRPTLSLNVSFSSDCSADSLRNRASTGRIGADGRVRLVGGRGKVTVASREVIVSKIEKVAGDAIADSPSPDVDGKRRCAWVTPNTESCYTVFHDEEWGVPIHEDKGNKIFLPSHPCCQVPPSSCFVHTLTRANYLSSLKSMGVDEELLLSGKF